MLFTPAIALAVLAFSGSAFSAPTELKSTVLTAERYIGAEDTTFNHAFAARGHDKTTDKAHGGKKEHSSAPPAQSEPKTKHKPGVHHGDQRKAPLPKVLGKRRQDIRARHSGNTVIVADDHGHRWHDDDRTVVIDDDDRHRHHRGGAVIVDDGYKHGYNIINGGHTHIHTHRSEPSDDAPLPEDVENKPMHAFEVEAQVPVSAPPPSANKEKRSTVIVDGDRAWGSRHHRYSTVIVDGDRSYRHGRNWYWAGTGREIWLDDAGANVIDVYTGRHHRGRWYDKRGDAEVKAEYLQPKEEVEA